MKKANQTKASIIETAIYCAFLIIATYTVFILTLLAIKLTGGDWSLTIVNPKSSDSPWIGDAGILNTAINFLMLLVTALAALGVFWQLGQLKNDADDRQEKYESDKQEAEKRINADKAKAVEEQIQGGLALLFEEGPKALAGAAILESVARTNSETHLDRILHMLVDAAQHRPGYNRLDYENYSTEQKQIFDRFRSGTTKLRGSENKEARNEVLQNSVKSMSDLIRTNREVISKERILFKIILTISRLRFQFPEHAKSQKLGSRIRELGRIVVPSSITKLSEVDLSYLNLKFDRSDLTITNSKLEHAKLEGTTTKHLMITSCAVSFSSLGICGGKLTFQNCDARELKNNLLPADDDAILTDPSETTIRSSLTSALAEVAEGAANITLQRCWHERKEFDLKGYRVDSGEVEKNIFHVSKGIPDGENECGLQLFKFQES